MADKPAWNKRAAESKEAFAAFQHYLNEGSIDAAFARAKPDQNQIGKRAPAQWFQWSAKHDWVARAAAYQEHLAEQDRLLWEDRRRQLREQDWSNSQEARDIIMAALPEASRFIERQERFVRGGNGVPDQLIITENFNIMGLMRALTDASKLQRLTVNEPTENINNLSGAALNAAIEREFARRLAELDDRGKAGAPLAIAENNANSNGASDSRDTQMPT